MSGFVPPQKERGAALLTVLVLVALTGALAAAALEKLRLSTATATNVAVLDHARAFAGGVQSLILLTLEERLAASPERTTLAGGWNGATRQLPMPGGDGVALATLRDGGNCFNLNSLVQGDPAGGYVRRPAGIEQFVALLTLLDVPAREARPIAEAAADWADSDSERSPMGAEDADYQQGERPYRTANTTFAEVSELRAVRGVVPETYERIRGWLCALPIAELSPINVNTLSPDQAPLLAMLAAGQIGVMEARRIIEARPAAGWSSMIDFWRIEALSELTLPLDVQLQPQLKTRWFAMELRVRLAGAEHVESALIDAAPPMRVVARRWILEG